MTSPIVINVPTRALLADETKGSFLLWLAKLNIKRNLTSMFVNKYLPYIHFVVTVARNRKFAYANHISYD